MTDNLNERLAAVQRAMAAPLPSPAELAAWAAEDKAMAERIHQVRPGVPLHHVYAVLESLRAVLLVDAATAAPSCRWPACLSEAEQQQLADDTGRAMLGEDTPLRPDPRPGCGCVDRGMELTREELQNLADEQGQDLYRARDLLAFVREMCDAADANGSPVTTERVRGWLAYTGCGGVLMLPDEVAARLAQHDVATPGCDCGHEGMGESWHRRDCVWRAAAPLRTPATTEATALPTQATGGEQP